MTDGASNKTFKYLTEIKSRGNKFFGHTVFRGKRSGEVNGTISDGGIVRYTEYAVNGAVTEFEGRLNGNLIEGRYTGRYESMAFSGRIRMER